MRNPHLERIQAFRAANKSFGFRARVGPRSETVLPAQLLAKMAMPPEEEDPKPVCELYFYDAIGADEWTGGGITAAQVVAAIKDAEDAGATSLCIYVNSPGGSVFEATAIRSVLERFAGPKNVFIDGLCASAATFVAMAGDTIATAPGGVWMIHNPYALLAALLVGDYRDAEAASVDMLKLAADLKKMRDVYSAAYAKRTGLAESKLQGLMDAETWMTAEEAKDFGFTDIVEAKPSVPAAATSEARAEARVTSVLSKFQRVPEHLRPTAQSLIAAMRAGVESGASSQGRTGKPAQDPRGARVTSAK